jgi:hypothetical protein
MNKLYVLVLLFVIGCEGGTDIPPVDVDAGPADAGCTNAFDERCKESNGCGQEGAFCCFRFYADSDVVKNVCDPQMNCVEDICMPTCVDDTCKDAAP